MSRARLQGGLTLVELMVCLAVLAAVLAMSVPALTRLQGNYQLRSGVHRLLVAVQMARLEALQRVQAVSVCPGRDHHACAGNYRDGWTLFVDADGDGVFDSGEDRAIAQDDGLPAGYQVTGRNGSQTAVHSITYRPDGSTWRNQTLLFCAPSAAGVAPYSIVLSMAGRARVARGEGQCPRA